MEKAAKQEERDALQSHHITHPSEISYSPGQPSMPPDTKSRAAFVSKLRRLRTHLSHNAFVRHCLSVRHLVCHAGRKRISVPRNKPHGKLKPVLFCLQRDSKRKRNIEQCAQKCISCLWLGLAACSAQSLRKLFGLSLCELFWPLRGHMLAAKRRQEPVSARILGQTQVGTNPNIRTF